MDTVIKFTPAQLLVYAGAIITISGSTKTVFWLADT